MSAKYHPNLIRRDTQLFRSLFSAIQLGIITHIYKNLARYLSRCYIATLVYHDSRAVSIENLLKSKNLMNIVMWENEKLQNRIDFVKHPC